MSTSLDRFAEHFECLRDLPAAQQAAALGRLALDDRDRERLARMLAADAHGDDGLDEAIAYAASRMSGSAERRLGAWQLMREIGAGGMGTVFLAERADGGFAQHAAIKVLRGFPTKDGMRRLRQERQILAGLDHLNIARLLDGGETADGQPWLALEHVDGMPLLEYARVHRLSADQRLVLFRAMLDAVEHAHQRLVIHRDIKPANVLVTHQGVVKLLDFGIARLVELESSAPRQTSTRVFSRGYASPEQREGRPITTASDVYSLGILLRELLLDRSDADPGDAAAKAAASHLDRELAGMIAKASAEDPRQRYAGATGFRDDLDRFRSGRPVRAAALTRRYRLHKFIGRHRLGVSAAVLAAIVLGGFVWQLDRSRERALMAEAGAQRALHKSERDAASARASLEFLTDAFSAASPDVALNRQVSVRNLLDVARAKLTNRSGADQDLVQTMQRLLARLYDRLGESTIAASLMRDGLAGIQPADATEALRLADDYSAFADMLGFVDDGAGSLAAARQSAHWREQFAPDDVIAQIDSLQALAVAHHRNGDDEMAIATIREAKRLASAATDVSAVVQAEIVNLLASLLARGGECDEALTVAQEALAHVDAVLDAKSPDRLTLMRSKASALVACGRPAEAEALLRAAISLHGDIIGAAGTRMMSLTSDLAIALNELGRYREAAEMLGQSDRAMTEVGLDGLDPVISFGNHAGILENAGDYDGALRAFASGLALLDQRGIGADHAVRRRLERARARTLALTGKHAEAFAALTDLRARCLRIEGEGSGEYAMLTWQLALVARRMQRADLGVPLLDDAERRWAELVPESHPVFAHILRARAAFDAARGDYAEASRRLDTAVNRLQEAQVSPVDLAIARSELAAVKLREHRSADAGPLLRAALPVLRASVLPAEINRLAAEASARQAGMAD